jgi:hypothetical protein
MRRLNLFRDPKRLLPILLGSVAGILILVHRLSSQTRFNTISALERVSTELLRWVSVLATFALLVGVVNVVAQHGRRLMQRDSRWPYSIALLLGVFIPPLVALVSYFSGQPRVLEYQLFQDVVNYVYTPLSISLLALLTFFAVTASIRALSSGNREAIVLVVVAGLMLLAQLPLLTIVPLIGDIVAWIQNYLALAGIRGLVFGAAIGAVIASVRILLGRDHPYLDR